MGQRRTKTCDVVLESVSAPVSNIIRDVLGLSFKTAMKVPDRGRLNIATVSCALASCSLGESRPYARDCKRVGKAIGQFQLIQAMLADGQAELLPGRSLVKLMQHGGSGATLRIGSGDTAMSIRARGRHRFGGEARPNDITLTHRNGQWFVSVTRRVPDAACGRERTADLRRRVDFGVTDWATFDDGRTIANPRWLRTELPKLAALQRQRARKKKGSLHFKRLGRRIARLHDRISNLRRDFVHKHTTRMVLSCAVLATEQLAAKNMSRSAKGTVDAPGRRVRQKAGLNREILSAAFGLAHPMLAYKAEEAGTRLHLSNTRQLKPSQRCSAYWELVPKTRAERMHVCPHCGHVMQRDQNSALVVLIDAHNTQDAPGTGVAARPKPLPRQRGKSRSVTRETLATTPCV